MGEDWERWVRRFFRVNSRTFSLATRLLPRPVRLPVAVVYWYCRTIDNIADDATMEPARALVRLEHAAGALDRCLDGRPDPEPLWQSLSAIHAEWRLPRGPMFELVDGARWDLEGRSVKTFDDLIAYSELVAGSIGEMMLPFLQQELSLRPDLIRPARALGVAMQITNILRDVGEDLVVLSRCYLPEDMMREAGIEAGSHPDVSSASYRELVERLMTEAEQRYETGIHGVTGLAPGVRFGITTAARLYREILNEIRSNAYDNVTTRAVVPPSRKLLTLARDGYHARKRALTGAS